MSRFEFDPMTHEPFRQEPTENAGEGQLLLDSQVEPDWFAPFTLGADEPRDQRPPSPAPSGSN
jgi:hypothetical protein